MRTARLGLTFGLAMGLGLPARAGQPLLGQGPVPTGDYLEYQVSAIVPGSVTVDQFDPDIDFTTQGNPGYGMDPTYGGSTPLWALSSSSLAPASHPGVAYMRLTTTTALQMNWTYGSKLANGGYQLPTSFRHRQVGVFDPDGPGTQPFKSFAYYNYGPWTAAGSSRVQYIQAGQSVDMWFECEVRRQGLADPGGLYSQTSPFTITFSALP